MGKLAFNNPDNKGILKSDKANAIELLEQVTDGYYFDQPLYTKFKTARKKVKQAETSLEFGQALAEYNVAYDAIKNFRQKAETAETYLPDSEEEQTQTPQYRR